MLNITFTLAQAITQGYAIGPSTSLDESVFAIRLNTHA